MKKVLVLTLAFVLVAAMSVGLTLALLTDTDEVKNTFTVGEVDIELDETEVTEYGVIGDNAKDDNTVVDRVKGNEYKLIPGHTYTKDPKVTVYAKSEACYVFVKVEDGLDAIEAETKIADQIVSTTYGWTKLTGVVGVDNVYYKEVADTDANQEFPVFGTFKLTDTAAVADYKTAQIKVTAYAVQADGFNSAAEAWAAVTP